VARQRKAIVDGLRDSVVGFQSGVTDVTSRDVRARALACGSLHVLAPARVWRPDARHASA